MYTINFEGEPKYQATFYSEHGYPMGCNKINAFFRNLKKKIKMGTVTDFLEKENGFVYTTRDVKGTIEKYEIPKNGVPTPILENINELIYLFKAKDRNKHPLLDYMRRYFSNEIKTEKEFRDDYLDEASFFGIFGTVIYWIFMVSLAFATLYIFSIPALLEALTIFLVTLTVKRNYRPVRNTIKETLKILNNRDYFSSEKKSLKKQKHKVIKIRKRNTKNKSNIIKESIAKEIANIEEIISILDVNTQRNYQIELYNLLATYKEKLSLVREQVQNLTLVYERDIDTAFLSALYALEARIVFLHSEDDTKQHDLKIEEIMNNLKNILGDSVNETKDCKIDYNEEQTPLGRVLEL